MPQRVQIVAPAHNEEAVVPLLFARLAEVFAPLAERYTFELLLVDDCSSDGTFATAVALHQRDPRLKVLRLARQFGHQLALKAGLDHADAEVVISMDSDLQHPPETIPALLVAYEAGHNLVFTQREGFQGGFLKQFLSDSFYRLANKVSQVSLLPASSDFRLYDRKALRALQQMNERDPFLRGLSRWIGYRWTVVPYQLAPRAGGRSKYRLRDSARLALAGITAFSMLPLQVWTWLGAGLLALSLAGLAWALVASLGAGQWLLPGLTLAAIGCFGSLQLLAIGVVGEYIGRIFFEQKRRPLYLVDEAVGFPAERP